MRKTSREKGARSHADSVLRAQIGSKLRPVLKQKRWSQQRAATELGITRVALNRALNGKATPRSETLARMCDKLDVTFKIGNKELGARDFWVPGLNTDADRPEQFPLPLDTPVVITSEGKALEVRASRKSSEGQVEFHIILRNTA